MTVAGVLPRTTLREPAEQLRILPPTALPGLPAAQSLPTEARIALGVLQERQVAWRGERQAFGEWRAARNRVGTLVLQFPALEDLRGGRSLSSRETRPLVILVNQSDWVNSGIFTLVREFGHVLLAHTWQREDQRRVQLLKALGSRYRVRTQVQPDREGTDA